MRAIITRLPERFQWTIHNMIAHPLSELLFQFGLDKASGALHDATVPYHIRGEGRG